uniref:Mitochondrial assembly of ribosomal large subunit protein 1 n=2 Tax=Petromyzon marinus TaxID=7757 RepID=A0AAJ7X0J5_PETMA|nr:mitochondrial assembly of ribosomal large subunit protein 1 [Petromyzon marinus]
MAAAAVVGAAASRRGVSLATAFPRLASTLSASTAEVSTGASRPPSRVRPTPALPRLASLTTLTPPKISTICPTPRSTVPSSGGSAITAFVSGVGPSPFLRSPSSVVPPRGVSTSTPSVPSRAFASGARGDDEEDEATSGGRRRRKKRWDPTATESGEDMDEQQQQQHLSEMKAMLDPRAHVAGDIVGMPLDVLVAALHQENGRDLCVINVPPELNYVDYFVVVTGSSTRHLRAMAEYTHSLYKYLKMTEYEHVRIEGHNTDDWMCIDFGNIVVHFMLEDVRERLELEKLWTLREDDDQLSSIPCETFPLEFVGDPTEFFKQEVLAKKTTPHAPLG